MLRPVFDMLIMSVIQSSSMNLLLMSANIYQDFIMGGQHAEHLHQLQTVRDVITPFHKGETRGNSQRSQWHPTPVLLPGKSHGRRSLVGCSPWGREELDTTERLHFHFSLSCIGQGNGDPLQCFCLENPRDREAWWAALYGVTQSRTRLKRLSSSSRGNSGSVYSIY